MLKREGVIVILILLVVIGITAWSKLRYMDREGYDEPTRWKLEEHPSLNARADDLS